MKTTSGKVTTTKSRFLSLAKAIFLAERGVVPKWIDAYNEYKRNGGGDKKAFAKAWALAVKGTDYDTNTVDTIRINISLIEWANENIKGGASACKSMAHIQATRSPKATTVDAKKPAPVSVKTWEKPEYIKSLTADLVEAGLPRAMAKSIAEKSAKKHFVTK